MVFLTGGLNFKKYFVIKHKAAQSDLDERFCNVVEAHATNQ
jgi:hypothetical protein